MATNCELGLGFLSKVFPAGANLIDDDDDDVRLLLQTKLGWSLFSSPRFYTKPFKYKTWLPEFSNNE